MDRIPPKTNTEKAEAIALLQHIADTLDEIRDQQSEFFGVHLAAKFPYGRPTDRWARPRRGGVQ